MGSGMVTVVVPVYKTEKYLDRCIESIVNQTYKNLEIILVDDGSPDSCPQKCEEWANKDSRIKVIHKINAGLGMARNTGMEHATGDYIYFCDSDDYVALDAMEHAVELAKADNADLVLFGMNRVGANGDILGTYCPNTEKTCYEGAEILDFVLPNVIEGSSKVGRNFNLNMSAWSCLFSMKLIAHTHWRFVSEREYISEDFYSLLQLYAHVQRVSVLKQACYYYCYNSTSLTQVFRPDRYERICHCYRAMLDMCGELQYPEKIVKSLSAQYFGNVIGTMKMIVKASDLPFGEKVKRLQEVMDSETLAQGLQQIDFASETFGRKLLISTIRMNCAVLIYWLIKAKLREGT